MNTRNLALSFLAIVTTVAIVFSACKKINEATELGGGLIPPIDNITTFDTSLTIQAFNDTFGLANDSQYISKGDEFFLGKINSDPFFGKTDARMFFELKPAFYKYTFATSNPDSLAIDSVVLVMGYVETYGDTLAAQSINVYEMDQSNNFKGDSSYLIRQNSFTYSNLLGSRTVIPATLNDSVKSYRDTTANQLRIRLSNSFGTRLLSYDSTSSALTGAYGSDSAFRSKFKGFAVQSMGPGNAVMGFDMNSANTKLAIYYRYRKGKPDFKDTTVAYFNFFNSPTSLGSAAANLVKRDYTGTPLNASLNNGTVPDPIIYLQNTPGSFANLKLTGLAGLSNRTIHRAELIVEQLYDISDSTFRPPDFLYLDAYDPTITKNYKYRTIPYDLAFTNSGALNLGAFGAVPLISIDGFGNKIRQWKFNISRYVQHVLTGTQTLYDLRLSAPYFISEQLGIPPGTDITTGVFVNQSILKGRIRVVGNTGSLDPNPRRIRLRLIYSKL